MNQLRKYQSLFILIFSGWVLFSLHSCNYYYDLNKPNVRDMADREEFIYVPSDGNKEKFLTQLKKSKVLNDVEAFERAAERKHLYENWKPGRYRLTLKMTNADIIELINSGIQSPIMLKVPFYRTPRQLAAKLANKIEADSATLASFFYDNENLKTIFQCDTITLSSLFVIDSLEVNWDITPKKFLEKIKIQSDSFWNAARKAKADSLGLSTNEVCVLASIVRSEQSKYKDEWPIIAGLYLNRLRTDMPLAADPTVVFASGDFTLNRVYEKHTQINSPYNTYLNKGLPPGPICNPGSEAVDAVLNAQKHDYLFMCAKEDMSGRHNFAVTFKEHLKNAKAYQQVLNQKGIQ